MDVSPAETLCRVFGAFPPQRILAVDSVRSGPLADPHAPLISVVIEVASALPEGISEEELELLILESLDSVNPALILSTMGLLMLLTLGFLVPNLALLLRRFLDANIEAKWFWILLVASFVPFLFGVPALAIWIIAGFVPGTPGPNKFGDDPCDGETRLPPDEPVAPPPQIWPAS